MQETELEKFKRLLEYYSNNGDIRIGDALVLQYWIIGHMGDRHDNFLKNNVAKHDTLLVVLVGIACLTGAANVMLNQSALGTVYCLTCLALIVTGCLIGCVYVTRVRTARARRTFIDNDEALVRRDIDELNTIVLDTKISSI